jgi:hypothetical protein
MTDRKTLDQLNSDDLDELYYDVDNLRAAQGSACRTVADMHAAAVGEVRGPTRGVVEDVADVRERAVRAEAAIEAVAEVLADHNGGDWSRHPATEAIKAALTIPPAPGPAATEATDDWEQQDDGTWTLPIEGGTILFTRRTTAEERARFAATWKPPAAVPCFTAHPVTPDMEAAATARAVQAAEDSERAAAWSTKHCAPDARTDQLQQRIHELESHARDANRLRTDWTAMRNRAETAEQQRDQYAALVRDFLDPDPCQFDQHGYCQAHAAGLGGEPMSCPHRRAREVLADLDSADLNPQEPTP